MSPCEICVMRRSRHSVAVAVAVRRVPNEKQVEFQNSGFQLEAFCVWVSGEGQATGKFGWWIQVCQMGSAQPGRGGEAPPAQRGASDSASAGFVQAGAQLLARRALTPFGGKGQKCVGTHLFSSNV